MTRPLHFSVKLMISFRYYDIYYPVMGVAGVT